MGSVIDYIDCPRCGNEAHDEFYYKTGEEYTTCTHCGYSRKFYIDNMEELGNDSEIGTMPNYKIEEYEPNGIYRIKQKGAQFYEFGCFTKPEDAEDFVNTFNARKDELVYAMYTTYADGKVNYTVLLEEENTENLSPENQIVT